MIALGPAALLLAALPSTAQAEPRPALAAEDLTGQGVAFVEAVPEREACFVHEPLTVHLRFGVAARFLDESAVQLFQRELDVPVQLQARWLDALAGATASAAEPHSGPSVAVGERIERTTALPDRVIDGTTYRVLELARTYVAESPGTLALEAPVLRFAFATRFEDDFVQGRRALDRRDALVRGTAARIEVRALPEEGRPPEFGGAVGRFTLEASARPDRLRVGESLALTVVVACASPSCDLGAAAEPRLDDLADFHVRGHVVVARDPRTLVVRYDLVPLVAGVIEVPPVRFASFDPTTAHYTSAESAPVPLVVEEAAAPPTPAPSTPIDPRSSPSARALLVTSALVVLLALAFVVIALRLRARGRS